VEQRRIQAAKHASIPNPCAYLPLGNSRARSRRGTPPAGPLVAYGQTRPEWRNTFHTGRRRRCTAGGVASTSARCQAAGVGRARDGNRRPARRRPPRMRGAAAASVLEAAMWAPRQAAPPHKRTACKRAAAVAAAVQASGHPAHPGAAGLPRPPYQTRLRGRATLRPSSGWDAPPSRPPRCATRPAFALHRDAQRGHPHGGPWRVMRVARGELRWGGVKAGLELRWGGVKAGLELRWGGVKAGRELRWGGVKAGLRLRNSAAHASDVISTLYPRHIDSVRGQVSLRLSY
jgi:hypothetical protein